MNTFKLLDLIYDVIANNGVSKKDKKALVDQVEYIDYTAGVIVLKDHELVIRVRQGDQ